MVDEGGVAAAARGYSSVKVQAFQPAKLTQKGHVPVNVRGGGNYAGFRKKNLEFTKAFRGLFLPQLLVSFNFCLN